MQSLIALLAAENYKLAICRELACTLLGISKRQNIINLSLLLMIKFDGQSKWISSVFKCLAGENSIYNTKLSSIKNGT